jgi:hypothetical protein
MFLASFTRRQLESAEAERGDALIEDLTRLLSSHSARPQARSAGGTRRRSHRQDQPGSEETSQPAERGRNPHIRAKKAVAFPEDLALLRAGGGSHAVGG